MNLKTENTNAKPEVLRRDEREKKGAGFLPFLLSKLGLGGGGTGGLLGEGAVGWLGQFGGGLMASKAGMVALVLAGTTVLPGWDVHLLGPRVVKRLQGTYRAGILPKADSEQVPTPRGRRPGCRGGRIAVAIISQGESSGGGDRGGPGRRGRDSAFATDSPADAPSPVRRDHAAPHFNAAAQHAQAQLVEVPILLNSASGGGVRGIRPGLPGAARRHGGQHFGSPRADRCAPCLPTRAWG